MRVIIDIDEKAYKRAFPSKRFNWYSLSRHSMTIDVVKEDFDRIFEPQESEEV